MHSCGIWHPEPCQIITVQGLEITSDSGSIFGFSSFRGWDDEVETSGGPIAWAGTDGGVQGDVYFGSRVLTIEGDIEAPSHAALMEARAELGALLTRDRWGTMIVDETFHLGLVRSMTVSRRSLQITNVGVQDAIFTMVLAADDFPRRDAETQTAVIPAGGATLKNLGDMDAAVTATLRGPLTNPGLTWDDKGWRYAGTIASGQTLTVDMRREMVRNPSTGIHYANKVGGDWIALPPGSTKVSRTGTGSGSITLGWRSTWV